MKWFSNVEWNAPFVLFTPPSWDVFGNWLGRWYDANFRLLIHTFTLTRTWPKLSTSIKIGGFHSIKLKSPTLNNGDIHTHFFSFAFFTSSILLYFYDDSTNLNLIFQRLSFPFFRLRRRWAALVAAFLAGYFYWFLFFGVYYKYLMDFSFSLALRMTSVLAVNGHWLINCHNEWQQ